MPAPLLIPAAEFMASYAARVAAINASANVGRAIATQAWTAAPRVAQTTGQVIRASFPQAPVVPTLREAVTRAAPLISPVLIPTPTPTYFQPTDPLTAIRAGRVEIERRIASGEAVDPFAPGIPQISPTPFFEPGRVTSVEFRPQLNPWTGKPMDWSFLRPSPRQAPQPAARASAIPTPQPETRPQPSPRPMPSPPPEILPPASAGPGIRPIMPELPGIEGPKTSLRLDPSAQAKPRRCVCRTTDDTRRKQDEEKREEKKKKRKERELPPQYKCTRRRPTTFAEQAAWLTKRAARSAFGKFKSIEVEGDI